MYQLIKKTAECSLFPAESNFPHRLLGERVKTASVEEKGILSYPVCKLCNLSLKGDTERNIQKVTQVTHGVRILTLKFLSVRVKIWVAHAIKKQSNNKANLTAQLIEFNLQRQACVNLRQTTGWHVSGSFKSEG
jgi:hypothetical protein